MSNNRKGLKRLVITIIILFFVGLAVRELTSGIYFGKNIALIHIDGVIDETNNRNYFLRQLNAVEADPSINAVLLRINTPGGSAAASQELYNKVLRLRQLGIPVVASLSDTATSGGYYVAAACDFIVANGSTITGSIGAIMQSVSLADLYEKVGVDIEIIKSGEFKDTGNSARSLTEREDELLSLVIFDAWDQFVDDVATARNLDREKVELIADGRIMTGRQALEAGLIDALGGIDEAEQIAVALGGIAGSYSVKTYEKPASLLTRLLGVVSTDLLPKSFSVLLYQH